MPSRTVSAPSIALSTTTALTGHSLERDSAPPFCTKCSHCNHYFLSPQLRFDWPRTDRWYLTDDDGVLVFYSTVRSPTSTAIPSPQAEQSIQNICGSALWNYWRQLKHHLDHCSSEHQVGLLCPSHTLPHHIRTSHSSTGAASGMRFSGWTMLTLTAYGEISEPLTTHQTDASSESRSVNGDASSPLPEHQSTIPPAVAKHCVFACTDASRWVSQVINAHQGSAAIAQATTAIARMVNWRSIAAMEALAFEFCDLVGQT
ncbi:hypothetical protein H4R35_004618, partial [Dimargaris xerosporica]